MSAQSSWYRALCVVLFGSLCVGISPFSCENRGVNQASNLIIDGFNTPLVAPKQAQPEPLEAPSTDDVKPAEPSHAGLPEPEAVQILNELGLDQPEVYLAKGLAYMAEGRWDTGKSSLEHAYALVAQAQAKADAMGESDTVPEAQLHRRALRGRIAFGLGRLAIAEARYGDAIVEFGRVLRADPSDEDARWNLELAWHMENPSCLKRDDDHEPDGQSVPTKPYDPEKGTDRLLCPNNEDWYGFDVEQPGGGVFATVTGKVVQYDGDETRMPELIMIDAASGDTVMTAKLDGESIKVGQRTLKQATQYQFALRGAGTGEFAYEIAIEAVAPCTSLDDDHEPDNSPQEAKPIGEGQNQERLLCPNNQDWYAIEGEQDMDLYIRVRGEIKKYLGTEARKLQMVLFGPSSEVPLQLVQMADDELRLGIQGLPEDGTYIFGIGGAGDGEFTYNMDIVVTPPCPVDDVREENDEPQQAYALKDETPPQQGASQPGASQPGAQQDEGFKGQVGNLKACPKDRDYYTLTVPAETEVEVSAVFDTKRAPLIFELLKDGEASVPAKTSKDGKGIRLDKADKEITYTFLVVTETDRENNYFIKWAPPGEEGDDENQDQQDQNKQDQNQDQQDQQKQKPQPQGLSGDALLDALDKQGRNPQLEKALRERRVIPDLEDF
jgi:tetratricopeptide (TPR) repeat protein